MCDFRHVYGYSGDWGRDASHQSRMSNVYYIAVSDCVIYPACTLVVVESCAGSCSESQKYFTGHTQEVSALAVESELGLVASGEFGRSETVFVWEVTRDSSSDTVEINVLQELRLYDRPVYESPSKKGSSGSLGTRCLTFDASGELLGECGNGAVHGFSLCQGVVEGGGHHPLSIWRYI